MADGKESTEDVVRQLARLNMSTRKIAAQTGLSQSTVVRTLQRINTGPMPVFRDDMDDATQPNIPVTPPGPLTGAHRRSRGTAYTVGMVTLMAAVLLVAGAVAILAWRTPRVPVQPAPPQVMVCAHYTQHGYINGLQGESMGGCPGGWRMVQLQG
jgi:hypothetical protein